jgi:hypothetical protein
VKLLNKLNAVLPVMVRHILIAGILFLIVISNFLIAGISFADDIKVISDIQQWQHPVKHILYKYKVIVYKVELHNKTYPIFYVKLPYDPRLAHNDKYFKPLYYETLKANGFYNYLFVDRSFQCRINITWDKKSKVLSESLVDLEQ